MSRFSRHLRRRLVAGLLVAMPLIITYLVLAWLFRFADGLLRPSFELATGWSLPGVGLVGVLLIVYLLGFLGTNVLGRWLLHLMDAVLSRTPIISMVYRATKQVVDAFRVSQESPFKRVVLVEYPRRGAWTVAFATGPMLEVNGERMQPIFVPTTPNPTSGYMLLFPEADIRPTDMSTDEAFRMVVSGGFAAPDTIGPPSDTME